MPNRENLVPTLTDQRLEIPCAEGVIYPQIKGLSNKQAQEKINDAIRRKVTAIVDGIHCEDTLATGRYLVDTNEQGIFSVRFEVFMYTQGAAHGMTFVKSLTAALATGRVYELRDLFRKDRYYLLKLSDIIKRQIKDRDIPLTTPFERVSEDADYYLKHGNLVIYFQLYEYTPYAYGIPEFVIPFTWIESYLTLESPIRKLMDC